MNVEEFRLYCLSKKAVEECFPFDEVTLVFKVAGKMFALTGLDDEEFKVNLKCEPDKAITLREQYPDTVFPGYHMNKQHWNTVHIGKDLSSELLYRMIDESYDLIVQSFSKKQKELYDRS